jgi:hypothetical protein
MASHEHQEARGHLRRPDHRREYSRPTSAREQAKEAIRSADRAEAEAWSIRMEAYGGAARPSPTIGQCLSGGLGWLEVECNRCKTRASLPLDAIRRPRSTAVWGVTKMPILPKGSLRAAGLHDQADGDAGDRALPLGSSG